MHQAALDLFLDQTERSQLHFNLGLELYTRYFRGTSAAVEKKWSDKVENERQRQQLLFLCVDRLNSGVEAMNRGNQSLSLQLCEMNLEAASRAADLAAFDHSLIYTENGLELLHALGGDYWTNHYELSLGLHLLFARMCFVNGTERDTELIDTVDTILEKAKCEKDTTDARFTLIQYLAARGKFADMVDAMYATLEHYGESLPPNPTPKDARAAYEDIAARLGKMTDDEIADLPSIEKHPLKNTCIHLLDTMHHPLDHTKYGPSLQVLCACKMVDMTLKYGLGGSSASAFGIYGNCILAEFHDIQLSNRVANLANRLFNQMRDLSKSSEVAMHLSVLGGLISWSKPLGACMDEVLECYRTGMRLGMMGDAF